MGTTSGNTTGTLREFCGDPVLPRLHSPFPWYSRTDSPLPAVFYKLREPPTLTARYLSLPGVVMAPTVKSRDSWGLDEVEV